MLEFLKHKDFDFCNYIEVEMDYELKDEYPKAKIFLKDEIEITVYTLMASSGYDVVSIDFKDVNIATLRFIPKSKTMVDIMLNQIRQVVNELQSQEAESQQTFQN